MRGSWAHFIIVALMLQCTMPLAAFAAVVNGSFEAGFGSFTGWARIGDTSIQTSGIGIAPTDGRFMALLTTLCDFKTGARCENILRELPFSSNSAVPAATITQGFFGFTQAEISSFVPIGLTPNDPMGELGGTARAPLPTISCVLRSQPDRQIFCYLSSRLLSDGAGA